MVIVFPVSTVELGGLKFRLAGTTGDLTGPVPSSG
jgi:hypothetical protein